MGHPGASGQSGSSTTGFEMTTDTLRTAVPDGGPGRLEARRLLGYIAVVLGGLGVATLVGLRSDGILSCQSRGYGGDRYLSHCEALSYGDYDHGAFWFGLEPAAVAAVEGADVVMLGNSRLQLAFSTDATARWFAESRFRYYLLGFSHHGNHLFAGPLIRKLDLRPKVFVINTDLFFEPRETEPAHTVLTDPAAPGRYAQKRRWQPLHRAACNAVAALCRDAFTFFRSRSTGAWIVQGGPRTETSTAFDEVVDSVAVKAYGRAGTEFLADLPVERDCVIFTMVPTPRTSLGTARAVASDLGVSFYAPTPDGLRTFDASHLDGPSAERWSTEFYALAGPQIRRCLASQVEP